MNMGVVSPKYRNTSLIQKTFLKLLKNVARGERPQWPGHFKKFFAASLDRRHGVAPSWNKR